MSHSSSGVAVAVPADEAGLAAVRELFLEYAGTLGFSLGYQGFDREMAEFPGRYGPPDGSLLLAKVAVDGQWQAAGAVGLRRLEDGVCEMKRMYVRPRFRGLGLGETLARGILKEARRHGYRAIRLDTMPDSMASAERLYRGLGFVEIAAYYDNPMKGALYLECDLRHAEAASAAVHTTTNPKSVSKR